MYFSEAAMWQAGREAMESSETHTKVERSDIGATVYLETLENGDVVLTAFAGKRKKPDMYYSYRTIEAAERDMNEYFDRISNWVERNRQRKAEDLLRRAYYKSDSNVGDLFVSSWGYEQTNVDFYQIVAKKGYKVTLRKIAGETIPGSQGRDCDSVRPVRDAFVGEEFTRVISKYGIAIDRDNHLSKTEEDKAHYRSWYW